MSAVSLSAGCTASRRARWVPGSALARGESRQGVQGACCGSHDAASAATLHVGHCAALQCSHTALSGSPSPMLHAALGWQASSCA